MGTMTEAEIAAMERLTFNFFTRDGAWAFMRECDAYGIFAGFPTFSRITVSVRDAGERTLACAMAERLEGELQEAA